MRVLQIILKTKITFHTANDGNSDWVVFKAPNGGDTHGTSNNTRTELAQVKKWYPKTANDKLKATLKIMNVSSTGDARVAASYSVVVGSIIESADVDMKMNRLKYELQEISMDSIQSRKNPFNGL